MKRACALLLLGLAGCDRAGESATSSCPPPAVVQPVDPVDAHARDAGPPDTGFPRPVVAADDCALHDHTWPRAGLEGHAVVPRSQRPMEAVTLSSGRVAALTLDHRLAVYDPSLDRFTFIALPPISPPDRDWRVNQIAWAGADRVLVFGGWACKGKGCGSTGWAVLVEVSSGDAVDVSDALQNFGETEPSVLLADGRVLIPTRQGITTFDPASRTSSTHVFVPWHSYWNAVGLLDGRVLLLGNADDGQAVALYDPRTERVLDAAPMGSAHYEAPAVRLRDGRVLVAGGRASDIATDLNSAVVEIYDPWTNTWDSPMPLPEPARWSAGILLGCGGVAIVGGVDDGRRVPQPDPSRTWHGEIDRAWVYSPSKNAWTTIALQLPRHSTSIARLGDGTALFLGGLGSQEAALSVEWLR
jgi:hypothetical protein